MNILQKLFGKKAETSVEQANTKPLEERYNEAIELLDKFKRTAYLPITTDNENEFSSKSKMGGFPYLRNEQDWPECPNCKNRMQLFVQLNLNELPVDPKEGMIQLFYCVNDEPHCESDLEAFFPFSKAVVTRKIEIVGVSSQIEFKQENTFPEKVISHWKEQYDYPHNEDYDELGIDLEYDDDLYELMIERSTGVPIPEDKLFGWPYWIQGPEYPLDRKTGSKMELLFQVNSEEHLPYMFGDMGIGHLTQSCENEDELGFGWACH